MTPKPCLRPQACPACLTFALRWPLHKTRGAEATLVTFSFLRCSPFA